MHTVLSVLHRRTCLHSMVSFSLFLRSPVLPSELVGVKFGGWMVMPSSLHDPGNMVECCVAQFWYLNGMFMAAMLGCVFMGLAVQTWFPNSLLAVPDVKPPASQLALVSLSVDECDFYVSFYGMFGALAAAMLAAPLAAMRRSMPPCSRICPPCSQPSLLQPLHAACFAAFL